MKKIILLLISLILSNSSCKRIDGHIKIPLINNSNKSLILIQVAEKDTNFICNMTPNSAIDKYQWAYELEIKKDSLYDNLFNAYNTDWESTFKDPNHIRLYLYFYDKDTFVNYSCDTLKKNNWYLKRMELTLDYLNQNNWTITYP
jgi:hypothetical protein